MVKVIGEYNDPNMSIILVLKDKENSAISKELAKDSFKNVEVFLKRI